MSLAETTAANGPSCSSPAPASVRSRNSRSEFDATASGHAGVGQAREQLQRAGSRRHALQRLLHHQLVQLVHQRLALAGALEDRFQLDRRHRARGADQRPLVLHRELPPEPGEQRLLGARPGLLGVEQQAVVVEDHRFWARQHEHMFADI